jgi:hypothetical protein
MSEKMPQIWIATLISMVMLFASPVGALAGEPKQINPPMGDAAAKKTQADSIRYYRRYCMPKEDIFKDCLHHMTLILFTSASLGDYDTYVKYLNRSFGISPDPHCAMFVTKFGVKPQYSLQRASALMWGQEKGNYKTNVDYVRETFLCVLFDSARENRIVLPPVPDFPSTPQIALEGIKRLLGKSEAQTAKRFAEEVAIPYLDAEQAIYDKWKAKASTWSNAMALKVELAKNGYAEAQRRKFPDFYTGWMKGEISFSQTNLKNATSNIAYQKANGLKVSD